jgi:D-Lysine 5,6-aminomutase TIM-barrel domain of alpha subunit
MSGGTLQAQAELVRRRAADLAGELSRSARRTATIAQERAVLRMLGVDGLDRAGRPLSASLAERYFGSDRGRLARGVILPFVAALLEYDLPARDLALDVAAGAIDLGLEAELLERPDRLAATEKRASAMIDAALVRFDANRTVNRDMREVLGLPEQPWLGVALQATETLSAVAEIRGLVDGGADVIAVRVPASWEFAEARRHAGLEMSDLFEFEDRVRGRTGDRGGGRMGRGAGAAALARSVRTGRRPQATKPDAERVPAGSQRGLAALREATDEAAARRGCYASLMTVASAFAAPEQAVVAAFERIDYVVGDPIREIVEDNVDPERALADHAFAHRLQARAGSRVVIGSGPLALGADVASGLPSDAVTRSGRGLALQALGVELALADGLPPDRLFLGAVPDWVGAEGIPASILLESWLRSLVFHGHRLVVSGPAARTSAPGGVAGLVSALAGGSASLVIQPAAVDRVDVVAADLGAAAAASRAIRATLGDGALHGDAADVADRTLRAANAALERLAAEGWESLLGPRGRGDGDDGGLERLGSSAVVERADGLTSGARLLQVLG